MTEELLYKYVSGQTTREETYSVREWAEVSDSRAKELARLKNIWILSCLGNEISQEIKEVEIKRILERIKELNQQEKGKSLQSRWIKYAAAVILLIGLSGTIVFFILKHNPYKEPRYTEIIVPRGERSMVVLPDGSIVKLNCGSQLKFPAEFNSGERRVFLQGEGFFDVAHDKSKPFIVVTSDIQVQVLGTRFNVRSYPEDKITETFLETGKIKAMLNNKDGIVLNPSEVFQYNKETGEYSKFFEKSHCMMDWTDHILTMRGETIEDMAKKLERRFDIKIIFGDNDVKNHIYTGSIKDEDLPTVLEALKFASSLDYKTDGKIVTLFSEKK